MGGYGIVLGPTILSVLLNTYLYGLSVFQFVSYQNTRYGDNLWINILVGGIFGMDTFHSGIAIEVVWSYCVTNFLNPVALASPLWTLRITSLCVAISAIFGQFFLSHRIYRLKRNKLVYIVLGILSGAGFALGVASSVCAFSSPQSVYHTIFLVWLVVQVSTNVIIAVLLTRIFSGCKPPFRAEDRILTRIIHGLIQSGILNVFFSIACLIFYLAASDVTEVTMLVVPLGRLYSNSIMDTLLCRPAPNHTFESKTMTATWAPTGLEGATDAFMNSGNNFNFSDIQVKTEIFTDASPSPPYRSLRGSMDEQIHESPRNAGSDIIREGGRGNRVKGDDNGTMEPVTFHSHNQSET